jgi:hypothetical protein
MLWSNLDFKLGANISCTYISATHPCPHSQRTAAILVSTHMSSAKQRKKFSTHFIII